MEEEEVVHVVEEEVKVEVVMMIMHMEREFEAKRPHMSKKYHFIGQNQLK